MPQYKELFDMAGAGIPQLLESSQERTEGKLNAKKDEGGTPSTDTPQIEG
jgi:hypothetical protein